MNIDIKENLNNILKDIFQDTQYVFILEECNITNIKILGANRISTFNVEGSMPNTCYFYVSLPDSCDRNPESNYYILTGYFPVSTVSKFQAYEYTNKIMKKIINQNENLDNMDIQMTCHYSKESKYTCNSIACTIHKVE